MQICNIKIHSFFYIYIASKIKNSIYFPKHLIQSTLKMSDFFCENISKYLIFILPNLKIQYLIFFKCVSIR
jgi:hypothetical protein